MKKLHKTFFSFGTVNTITVYFEKDEEVAYKAVEKVKNDMLNLVNLFILAARFEPSEMKNRLGYRYLENKFQRDIFNTRN
jgi:hypothetical protein